jgi:hypothetical protein
MEVRKIALGYWWLAGVQVDLRPSVAIARSFDVMAYRLPAELPSAAATILVSFPVVAVRLALARRLPRHLAWGALLRR